MILVLVGKPKERKIRKPQLTPQHAREGVRGSSPDGKNLSGLPTLPLLLRIGRFDYLSPPLPIVLSTLDSIRSVHIQRKLHILVTSFPHPPLPKVAISRRYSPSISFAPIIVPGWN